MGGVKVKPSPDNHWLPSRMTQMWMVPIVWRAKFGKIALEDLPGPPARLKADPAYEAAATLWDAECVRARAVSMPPRLIRALWYEVAKEEIQVGCSLLILSGLLSAVARPLLLRYAIRSMDPEEASMGTAMGYAAALSVCLFFENWTLNQGKYETSIVGALRVVSCMQYLVARKAIALQAGAVSEGKEATLVGGDLIPLVDMWKPLPVMFMAMTALVAGLVMLFYTAGASGFIKVLVMVVTYFLKRSLFTSSNDHRRCLWLHRSSCHDRHVLTFWAMRAKDEGGTGTAHEVY